MIEWARHSLTPPPFIRPVKRKGRRAEGARYERRIQASLCEELGDYYVPSPWFEFLQAGTSRTRWCQPDGLLFQPLHRTITILEVKLQHTSDAWWQTNHLYLPVVSHVFPPALWGYNICEVVKWFDPAVQFPWQFRKVAHPLQLPVNTFGVHIRKL